MASGSFKDTARSLRTAFTTSSTSPPPNPRVLNPEVQDAIRAFLEKHDPLEEHDVKRVQEELHSVYAAHVQKDISKRAVFLHALQLLRPAILGIARLEEWWKLLIRPVIDGVGFQRDEIEYATAFILAVLDHEEDQGRKAEESAHFMKLLLDVYLRRVKARASNKDLPSHQDSYVARRVQDIIITSGRRKPKDLLVAIDGLLVDKQCRLKCLELLCDFVGFQPPHLHRVSETQLIEHLLKCLMIDTSTTALSFALNSLIMFLPHIPSTARSHLPRLFIVYSRLLCWERFRPEPSKTEPEGIEEKLQMEANGDVDGVDDDSWQKLTSSYETTESTIPDLLYYFTFLYGLYPLNFTNYIRKPRKYLKTINFPRAEEFDLDQDLIRQRTIPYQQQHKLHRNFFQTTLEDELADNQWQTMDPAEVMSECMGLCIAHDPTFTDKPPVQSPFAESQTLAPVSTFPSHHIPTEEIPPQLLAETSDIPADAWNESRSPTATSPTLPPHPVLPSQKRLEIQRNGSVTSYHSVSDTPSLVGIPAAERINLIRSPALRPAPQHEATLAYLQRELALLRNELNFERYLKQQHLTHIGVLQRRQIEESNRASDLQNVVNTNKILKAKVLHAEEQLQSIRKETHVGRTQAKKVETDLSTRVRALRESERQWRTDEEQLRGDLERARKDCDQLRRLVVESEARELLSKQQVTSMTIQVEQVEGLKKQLGEAEEKLHNYEVRELQFEKAAAERDNLATEMKQSELRLQSQGIPSYEREAYEKHIVELERQLTTMETSQDANKIQKVVDRAVSALQNKHASLQTEHIALKQHAAELEVQRNELAHELAIANGGFLPANDTQILNPQAQVQQALKLQNTNFSSPSEPHIADQISPSAPRSPLRPSTAPSQDPASPALLASTFGRAEAPSRTEAVSSKPNNSAAYSPGQGEAGDRLHSTATPTTTMPKPDTARLDTGKPADGTTKPAEAKNDKSKAEGSPKPVRRFRGIRGII